MGAGVKGEYGWPGAGVYAPSSHGYGGSTGAPSEAGLLADARAAHAELTRRVAPARIALYGESLGAMAADGQLSGTESRDLQDRNGSGPPGDEGLLVDSPLSRAALRR